jgi:hypothetical protein
MSLSPRTQQALAVGMPMAAIALSLLIIYPTWNRYADFRGEVATYRERLDALRSAPLPSRDPVLPAADAVESEPSHFMGVITAAAAASGCDLVRLDVIPMTEKATDPPLVRPVRARVNLLGHYPRLRAFLLHLQGSSRLYTVTELTLNSTETAKEEIASPRLNAILTIERYVTPPARAQVAAETTGR